MSQCHNMSQQTEAKFQQQNKASRFNAV